MPTWIAYLNRESAETHLTQKTVNCNCQQDQAYMNLSLDTNTIYRTIV